MTVLILLLLFSALILTLAAHVLLRPVRRKSRLAIVLSALGLLLLFSLLLCVEAGWLKP